MITSSNSSSLTMNEQGNASTSGTGKHRFIMLRLLVAALFIVMAVLNLLNESSSSDPRRSVSHLKRSFQEQGGSNRTSANNVTAAATTNEEEETTTSYTLVVVHCRGSVEWLQEVPWEWRIVVYDKCGKIQEQKEKQKENSTEMPTDLVALRNHSQLTIHGNDVAVNAGGEECNGYFNFFVDYYDNLTDVTVFMHDDGLRPYDFTHDPQGKHTPFDTFQSVVESMQFVTKNQQFLHLGLPEIWEIWGGDPYHGEAMKILWPYFSLPTSTHDPIATYSALATTTNTIRSRKMTLARPPTRLSFKPSAHFAVRREQIHARPKHTYLAMLQQFQHSNTIPDYHEARSMCCAMERMWHIFFGQPPMLPKRAIASDLLNITKCEFCHWPEQP